jgi:hypothetical protein
VALVQVQGQPVVVFQRVALVQVLVQVQGQPVVEHLLALAQRSNNGA